jgi:hypothetical protein
MDWKLFTQLVFTAVVAFGSGWLGHYFSARRDVTNERRRQRIAFLLDAYRRLEAAANRTVRTPADDRAFESAIADIQLLGTKDQIEATFEFFRQYTSSEGASVLGILQALRADLRTELLLSGDVQDVQIFRFANK